jgi:lysophospholipase L1-like esterase
MVFPSWPAIQSSRQEFAVEQLEDLEKLKQLLAGKDRLQWVFTGDSITMGAKHTHGCRSYVEIFRERLQWELGRSWDIVINTGMSGHTSIHILDDFEWRVAQFKPAVVSLMIGTNDCSMPNMSPAIFKDNLESLIAHFRAIRSIPILHTPNPIILGKAEERQTLPEYIPVIRDVAQKNGVILVDNYAYWEEMARQKSQKVVFREWLNDPLHPNGNGHQEIAKEMFRTLEIYDPEAATCGGEYYEGEH